jgi:hypothetical protein
MWQPHVRLLRASAIAATFVLAAKVLAAPQVTPKSAESPTASDPEVGLESVTVEAQRRRERIDRQVSEYVYSIAGSGYVESLARWKVPVCPAVAGLAEAEADFVRQRIGKIATDAGVPLGEVGCAPNFVVVLTPDPKALLKSWWSEDHTLFNRGRGLGGVNRMIDTDRPVRVWHNACNVPPLRGYYQPSGQLNCNAGVTGSRLVWAAVRAIYSAIVVVDLARIEGLTFSQMTDYVAMVSLAQIRPEPELGEVPTILGVFAANGAERQKGLTAWDQSFLRAVYETTDGSVTEMRQIKLRMSEELAR